MCDLSNLDALGKGEHYEKHGSLAHDAVVDGRRVNTITNVPVGLSLRVDENKKMNGTDK